MTNSNTRPSNKPNKILAGLNQISDRETPLILIADDNDDSRLMLRFVLESWEFKVVEASDGNETVSLTESLSPDLILMDIRMPWLDGFETTRIIRNKVKNDGLPIIFISGCPQVMYRQRGIEAGGNDYLVKPIDFDLLKNTLDKYLPQPDDRLYYAAN